MRLFNRILALLRRTRREGSARADYLDQIADHNARCAEMARREQAGRDGARDDADDR